jgi:hypothetical protein
MKEISEGRKAAYYFGMILIIIGFLTFGSVFVSGISNFGNFSNFESRTRSEGTTALVGMALVVIGSIVMGIGARGAAGSGIVLDPKKAREDLEPFSRQGGGMLKDALDEADIHLGKSSTEKVVMIKCRNCQKLNEEDSKFCQECGKPL